MKKGLFIVLLLISSTVFPQKSKVYTFGEITPEERALNIYVKDTTANALFLYENGETHFKISRDRIIMSTTYYAKVKIFNKEGDANATIEIPIRHNKERSEKIVNIKGYTHNSKRRIALNPNNVFTEKVNEYWSVVKFTMPDIKEQSIIEYEYTRESPFFFNFKGWSFQTNIPKLYSRFHALIPGNYVYNRSLIGPKKLSKNEATIKKRCFHIPRAIKEADCEELTYVMEEIPAFIEEDYMLSKDNYISRIKFEISEFNGFDGITHKYTKRWKDVDKEFRTEKSIGKQLRKIDFLKKKLPKELFNFSDQLTKAQKTYNFIKNYFTWNNKTRLFNDVNVKEAFDNKIGNSTEINIAMINALNAVGLDAEIVLVSTRSNGLPIKLHPVISDFNYAIGKIDIDGKTYLLDATNKLLPFGMIPYKTLNGYGRVMDFDNESYWIDIKPKKNNQTRINMNLKINEDGDFAGLMHKSYNGYKAIEKRDEIKVMDEEKYLEDIEDKDENIIINSYKNSNLDDIDKPLTELFDIIIESGLDGKIVILNPFINSKIEKNPFQLKERTYPVDFGYPRSFQFTLSLTIPETYKISSLPEDQALKLPNGGGNYTFNIGKKNNKVTMISRFKISKSYFVPEEYLYLKEFYKQIIKTQNSLITLEKI